MAKSIKRNFIYNILLNISAVIFPLITAPYVSRVLEPDGVGLFNFANTYAGYFALFAALGIPYYGVRQVALIKDDTAAQTQFVSEIMSISTLVTIICTLLLFLSLIFIPQLNENYVVFVVAGVVLYMTPFKIDWFFRGREEFGYITFRSLVIKTLSVALLFLLVHKKEDLLIYVGLNAACQVLNDLWNYVKLYQSGIHPYFTLSGRIHLKPLFILFSSSIAISVYALLDTIMLGFMRDYTDVGYYNCATHLSKALIPIVTSLSAVMLPRITQYKNQKKWEEISVMVNKSVSLIAFLSFPITLGVISVAPVFIPLFYGSQYYGTILPLQIIIVTVILVGFSNLAGIQILLGLGFDKQFLYSIIVGAVSNFILNLLFIPMFGASGAAISSVVAEFVVLASMVAFIYSHTSIRFQNSGEIFIDLLIAATFIPICFFLGKYFEGWLFVFMAAVTCGIEYCMFQYLLKNPSLRIAVMLILRKTGLSKYEK